MRGIYDEGDKATRDQRRNQELSMAINHRYIFSLVFILPVHRATRIKAKEKADR
jgi:hypothetical protein